MAANTGEHRLGKGYTQYGPLVRRNGSESPPPPSPASRRTSRRRSLHHRGVWPSFELLGTNNYTTITTSAASATLVARRIQTTSSRVSSQRASPSDRMANGLAVTDGPIMSIEKQASVDESRAQRNAMCN